jgi:hypothetical protein
MHTRCCLFSPMQCVCVCVCVCVCIFQVFHPKLPANDDYPASWSDQPLFQQKFDCAMVPPPATSHLPQSGVDAVRMSCEYTSNATESASTKLPLFPNADAECADTVISRLTQWHSRLPSDRPPFFGAAGLQGPRLPWSFPSTAAVDYPDPSLLSLPTHMDSPDSPSEMAEWFRPTEIAWYVRVWGACTHSPTPTRSSDVVVPLDDVPIISRQTYDHPTTQVHGRHCCGWCDACNPFTERLSAKSASGILCRHHQRR